MTSQHGPNRGLVAGEKIWSANVPAVAFYRIKICFVWGLDRLSSAAMSNRNCLL